MTPSEQTMLLACILLELGDKGIEISPRTRIRAMEALEMGEFQVMTEDRQDTRCLLVRGYRGYGFDAAPSVQATFDDVIALPHEQEKSDG